MKQIIIRSTPQFDKSAKKLISPKALDELCDQLESTPNVGDVIRGTGGVRKLRWSTGKDNKGKSGGVRVIYCFDGDMLVLLLTIFAKKDKENITAKEKNSLKRDIPKLIEYYKEDL